MFAEQFLRMLWNVYKEIFTEIHGGDEARIILMSTKNAKFSFHDEIELDIFPSWRIGVENTWLYNSCLKKIVQYNWQAKPIVNFSNCSELCLYHTIRVHSHKVVQRIVNIKNKHIVVVAGCN